MGLFISFATKSATKEAIRMRLNLKQSFMKDPILYISGVLALISMVFAWPQAEISALKASAAVDLLCTEELKAAEDAVAARAQLTEEYNDKLAAPYEAAKRGYVDEIIDPIETRQALVYALGLLSTKN